MLVTSTSDKIWFLFKHEKQDIFILKRRMNERHSDNGRDLRFVFCSKKGADMISFSRQNTDFLFFFIKDWSLPGDFTNFYVQDGLQSAKDIYHINTFIIKCIKKQDGTGIYCTESQLENQ